MSCGNTIIETDYTMCDLLHPYTTNIEFKLHQSSMVIIDYWSHALLLISITTECVGLPVCVMRDYLRIHTLSWQTGSPTCLEFNMCIVSTACDRNKQNHSHSDARNFTCASPIDEVPLWSAVHKLSDGVIISVWTKCNERMVYAERVTSTYVLQ